MIRNPVRRRQARSSARACVALSATMLATTAWLTVDGSIRAASAEVAAGTALVIVPDDGRPDGGQQLDAGGEDTEFSLRLPDGASCPGDSKDGNFRVTSYVVPASKDPATLEFDSEGPQPQQYGPPQESFAMPLIDVYGSSYIVAMTADADPPGGPGPIINLPAFNFAAYEPAGTGDEIPAGDYNVGIACFVPEAGRPALLQSYWNVEMTVTQSADDPPVMGWAVTQDVLTQTLLTVDPAGSAAAGDPVKLMASVTPADVPGTVTFLDDGTPIGEPVVTIDGRAEITSSDLPPGARDFTARFTPSADGYVGATSEPVSYTIEARATTTTLTATPPDGAAVGDTVTLTAVVAPGEAAGTVTFLDGTATLGEGALEAGTATLDVTALAAGTHTLTARFAPASGSPHAGSTSAELAYEISGESSVTVVLTVAPQGEAEVGEDVSLTAQVTAEDPADLAGEVEFVSGATTLGTAALSDGKASVTVDDLAVGDHSLTARFVPSADRGLGPVTSAPVAFKVVAAATTTSTSTSTSTSTTTTTALPSTEVPTSTTTPGAVLSNAAIGGGSVTGSGTLPMTGGSLSLALWAVLLVVSGRVAVLLGRQPEVRGAPGDGA